MEALNPSTIDASPPFSSVKEAVAIFGERLRLRLPRETRESPSVPLELLTSPKTKSQSLESEAIIMPKAPQNIVHGNDLVMMLMVLKKLESEVQDTKKELNLFKSETQLALASLHNNMSRVISAKTEGEAEIPRSSIEEGEVITRARSREDNDNNNNTMVVKSMDSPTLAKILSITSDYQRYNFREGRKANNKNKVMKMKPIVPLVTDIFPWKKSALFSSREYM